MKIEIDKESGFCFGVMRATSTAEKELIDSQPLYCLGDIVHNGQEVERLTNLGLITINYDQFKSLKNAKVLLRAHGEPPATYKIAKDNNIEIVDASCPVVLKLQQKIKIAYDNNPDAQIVIYGKIGHAEVIGLEGQTNGTAIVIESEADLYKIDFTKPLILFSQTTKSVEGFNRLVNIINDKLVDGTHFEFHDTICRQVANRIPNIRRFASNYDVILFVAGAKSSNGKVLLSECKSVNPKTYLVSNVNQIRSEWFNNVSSVGICGATSTPKWLMEDIANKIKEQY